MKLRSARGITMVELMVVVAVILILAGVLFPAFGAVKQAAQKSECLSDAKQIGLAIAMYGADNEDTMVPANSGGVLPQVQGFGGGHPDHIWAETIQPYVKSWTLFRCPNDVNGSEKDLALDPKTGLPIPLGDENYYYSLALRSDFGLNYDFLSPWYNDAANHRIGSVPITLSQSTHPSITLEFVDTVWDRYTNNGEPKGGGKWVADAPCVYNANGVFLPGVQQDEWQNLGGWQPNQSGKPPFSGMEFGGAWARHSSQVNVSYLDGHAKSLTLGALQKGCDVQASFGGRVTDPDSYLWSP